MEFKDLIASTPSIEREQSKEVRFSFIQGGYVEDLDVEGAYSLTLVKSFSTLNFLIKIFIFSSSNGSWEY